MNTKTDTDRARWERVPNEIGKLRLVMPASAGGTVIGGIEKAGAGAYVWWAVTKCARVNDVSHSEYAAQLAVRRALREHA